MTLNELLDVIAMVGIDTVYIDDTKHDIHLATWEPGLEELPLANPENYKVICCYPTAERILYIQVEK